MCGVYRCLQMFDWRLETSFLPLFSAADSLLWQQVASSREECVQIDTLIPGGHYQFRVRASNRWGLGPPSEPSNMVTLPSGSKSVVIEQLLAENSTENDS